MGSQTVHITNVNTPRKDVYMPNLGVSALLDAQARNLLEATLPNNIIF